jgi:predicted cobalt transporter CbtA
MSSRFQVSPARPTRRRFSWLARVGALALGVALCVIGISLAADVGEILVAAPLLFFGGFGVLFAATGRVPSRLRRLGLSHTPHDER